jgi:hypothetical protein
MDATSKGFQRRTKAKEAIDGLILAGNHVPTDVTFAIAAAAANVSEVTITVVNKDGYTIPGVHVLDLWLSDAATGVGLTGTTASGTVQAKAASGTVHGALTAKKALRVSTLATGVFILEITDAAKTGFYVAAALGVVPAQVSVAMVAGSYGA